MINIKSNAINRNVHVLYQIKRTGGWGGSLRTQWQPHCSGYMLAYCVFNATSLPSAYGSRCPADIS